MFIVLHFFFPLPWFCITVQFPFFIAAFLSPLNQVLYWIHIAFSIRYGSGFWTSSKRLFNSSKLPFTFFCLIPLSSSISHLIIFSYVKWYFKSTKYIYCILDAVLTSLASLSPRTLVSLLLRWKPSNPCSTISQMAKQFFKK